MHIYYERSSGKPLYTEAKLRKTLDDGIAAIKAPDWFDPNMLLDFKVQNGALKLANIQGQREQGLAYVADRIGTERAKRFTTIPMQDALYRAKKEEAERFLSSFRASADDAEFPLLAADIGIFGDNFRSVAEKIIARDRAWHEVAAPMERARNLANKRIREAQSIEDLQQAQEAFDADLAKLPAV